MNYHKFTIGETDYEIPANWHAVTFNKYLEWLNDWVSKFPTDKEELTGDGEVFDIEFPVKLLSFQTGIPLDVLMNITATDINDISLTQTFWYDLDFTAWNVVDKEITEKVNIVQAPAKHMIGFVHALNALNGKHELNVMPQVIHGYFGIDITDQPVTQYFGLATFFLSSLAITGLQNPNIYNLNPQTLTKLRRVLKSLKVLA